MEWLLIALGLKYPSADYALNNLLSKACVKISGTSYVVRNRAGFTEAVNKETGRRSRLMYATNHLEARSEMLEVIDTLHFPCAVFFSDTKMDCVKLDYDQSDALE